MTYTNPTRKEMGSLMASKSKPRSIADQRHPDYAAMLPHWDFCERTYRGGRDWFKLNVFKYCREGDNEFSDRLARAYRFNHTREVVDLVSKYIFRGDIQRDESRAPESVRKFWLNATKNERSIYDLLSDASRMSSVFGMPYMVIDRTRPQAGTEVLTLADEKAAALKTYAYLVRPQDVLDLSLDDTGALNWILIRGHKRNDEDFFADDGAMLIEWRLWTRERWVLFGVRNRKGERVAELTERTDYIDQIDSGLHNLGEVPVIRVLDRVGDADYSAPSLIDDIAYLDRAAANYLSNLDAIIQDQTFSQLVIPAQAMMPDEDEYKTLIELGTKRVFAYDSDGANGAGPRYISPDPKQAQIILAVITKIITEIYHSIGIAGERTKSDNAAGIDNSSGVAKAYDFDRMNAMLAQKAARLAQVENDAARLVAKWSGDKAAADLVQYPKEFDVRSLYDEFEIADRLSTIQAPDKMRQVQAEKLLDKMYPQLPADVRAAVVASIKKWPPEPPAALAGAPAKPSAPVATADNRSGQVVKDADAKTQEK